jgi:[ribosomal protein S5]-alanine N-acetyltransferase
MSKAARRLTYPEPKLRDGVVRLRPWSDADLACVEAATHDPYIPETTTVPAVFTEAEGLAWIERQRNRQTSGEGISLAIAEVSSDDALGAAVLMLGFRAGTVSIGYWLVPAARGHGLASRAVLMLAPWALTQAGVARVEALVEPDNTASQRILEVAGFERQGLLPSYLAFGDRRADVLVYSLIASDLEADSLETP